MSSKSIAKSAMWTMTAMETNSQRTQFLMQMVQAMLFGMALTTIVPKYVTFLGIAGLCYLLGYDGHTPKAAGISGGGKAPSRSKQTISLFLTKFPAEIRNQVYRELLISKDREWFDRPDLMMKAKTSRLVYDTESPAEDVYPRDLGVHVAILQTCHRVYVEALPILYRENIFAFTEAGMLEYFKKEGLDVKRYLDMQGQANSISVFNLKPCLQGRLSLIRNLYLKITKDDDAFAEPTARNNLQGFQLQRLRDAITKAWKPFLLEETGLIRLPNLKELCLCFKHWNLETYEWIAVRLEPHNTSY